MLKKTSIILTFLSLATTSISQAQISRLTTYYNTPYQESYQRVASGYNHYLEIKNGKLYACGSNNDGELGVTTQETFITEPIQVGTDENWATISAGYGFSMAIKADGTLWAWGKNNYGQLGIDSDDEIKIPTQVGSDKWFSVSAGYSFSLAIKADGTLWAWGRNNKGQLGNGTSNSDANSVPVQIGTDNNWWRISAGYRHSLALKADGTLWTWGSNSLGQLGNGTNNTDANPNPIQIGTDNWKSVSAGGFFSTAIKSDGTLWAWGDNYYGQIANGNTESQLLPTQIETDKWKSVYAGRNHIVALKADGTVHSWADETGEGISQAGTVSQKTELSGIVQISAGDSFSFALKSNGELYSWGKNNVGQLGKGNTVNNNTPTFNNSVSEEIINVAAAHWFTTFSLYSNGTIKGWGANDKFQLGIDTSGENQISPIDVPTAKDNNIAVLTSIYHTLIMKDNGTIWGWGDANVLGIGVSDESIQTATQVGSDNDWLFVTTGSFSSAGIKTDGTLWTWGFNFDEMLGTEDGLNKLNPTKVGIDNNWRTVAMGDSHTIAIKSDGTLWGWGRNYSGQAVGGTNQDDVLSPTQIGTDSDWVYVSAATGCSMAIKADGTLWGWGVSGMGQLGFDSPIPTKTTELTQIGNESFIQARLANWSGSGITAEGNVLVWGNLNTVFGELGLGNNVNYPTPTLVPNKSNVVHISGGQVHKSILKSSRKDVCMVGRNANGELGIGSPDISINAYQCGIASVENQTSVNVDEVIITVQNDETPEITTENGTLQLVATVNPPEANQNVAWSVISGDTFASVNADGLVTAISNGTAKIRATSVEDQLIFGEIDIVIDHGLSTENYNENYNVRIYPNPSNGIVNMKTAFEIEKITVSNLIGQQITVNSSSDNTSLDLSDLPAGNYLVKVTTRGVSKTFKVVKR